MRVSFIPPSRIVFWYNLNLSIADWSKNTKLKTIFGRKLKHGKGDATQRIRRKSKEAKDLGGVTEETELLHGTTLDDRCVGPSVLIHS